MQFENLTFAGKEGDYKFMTTLLPSFNENETQTKSEILTSRDYRLTDVKWLTLLNPFFLFLRSRAFKDNKFNKLQCNIKGE